VGVFEQNAAFRELVKKGRGLTGISVATYVIGAQRVDGNEEDASERRAGIILTGAEEQECRAGSGWGKPPPDRSPRVVPAPQRCVSDHLHSWTIGYRTGERHPIVCGNSGLQLMTIKLPEQRSSSGEAC
jgi:hypothetical protein